MTFFQRLFHRHKWVTVKSRSCTARLRQCLYPDLPSEPVAGVTVLQKCSHTECEKERAYLSCGTSRSKVDVAFAKHKMDQYELKSAAFKKVD